MATASANRRDGAGRLSKASPANARSPLAAFDAHQRGRASYRALSRGHGAHVRQMNSGFCRVVSPALCLTTSCELGAGFGQRPFHPHSRLVPLSSPGVWTNRPVRLHSSRCIGLHSPAARHSAERGAFIHGRVSDCSPSRVQLLQDQPSQNRAVLVVNHLEVLSSSLIAWFQPSEAAHGRVPKSPRAFHRKEGELPNVCG